MNVQTLDQQETLSPFDRRKFLSTLLAGAGGAALQMSGGNALGALATTAKAVSPTHDYFYGMNGHLAWTSGIYQTWCLRLRNSRCSRTSA